MEERERDASGQVYQTAAELMEAELKRRGGAFGKGASSCRVVPHCCAAGSGCSVCSDGARGCACQAVAGWACLMGHRPALASISGAEVARSANKPTAAQQAVAAAATASQQSSDEDDEEEEERASWSLERQTGAWWPEAGGAVPVGMHLRAGLEAGGSSGRRWAGPAGARLGGRCRRARTLLHVATCGMVRSGGARVPASLLQRSRWWRHWWRSGRSPSMR